MPSLFSRWLRRQIRRLQPMLADADMASFRSAQDKLGEFSSRVLQGQVTYGPAEGYDAGVACWARPKEAPLSGAILYLHGGGYVAGSLPYAKLFGGVLAGRLARSVLCLGYRLAPENPYPAALDDAMEAYEYLLEREDPRRIAVIGESAGGGLSFCLAHRLIQENKPLPACLVGISPWADLTMTSHTYVENEDQDVALTRWQLAAYANAYAPLEEQRMLKTVSPVLGDLKGFPPALLLAGGGEILLDDARMLYRGYALAKGECTLVIQPGMWHAYPLYRTKESKAALTEIRDFVGNCLSRKEGML